jgi:hypothetical protein
MIIVVAAIKVISRDKNQAVAQASPYAARL